MSRAVAVREWAQRSEVGVATFQPSMLAKLGGAVERVTGIGGVFFRSSEPERLAAWYAQHLGLICSPQGDVVWQQEAGPTVWAPFPQDSDYLGRPEQQVMLNFRVRDLDAMLAQLHDAGIDTDDEVVEAAGIGRFAHVRDPAGTRLELWEPPDDR